MLDEDKMISRRVEASQPANPYTLSPSMPVSSAFAAVSSRPRSPRFARANCKREGHLADFCVSPGGKKMAGRLVDEVKFVYYATVNRRNSRITNKTIALPVHIMQWPTSPPLPLHWFPRLSHHLLALLISSAVYLMSLTQTSSSSSLLMCF